MRAGIYARYSSEHQNERSIEDQLRLCREFADKRGDAVVDIFSDFAISGSSLKNRPQALRLLEEARAGHIDVVITEALDRLSRDQEDVAGIFKRLAHAGAIIVTTAEGEINELHIGLKGTMNALFLKDLAAKVRRGQRGRIEAGFSAGGRSYGYRVVREIDASGELKRGLRAIDPTEAIVVKRIYADYLAGRSPRAIAAALNREGVAAPFGRHWNASTLNGNFQRGNGILCNALYAGKLVYNRVRMVKDPETGKRVSRLNPPAEWITREAPELRIIDADQWEAVQARKRATLGVPNLQQRRPRHLFSGLARCGCCGGAYAIKSRNQLGCSNHVENGTCSNGRRIGLAQLESRVLDGVRDKLLSPEVIRRAAKTYHAERSRLAAGSRGRQQELESRITALSREIERLVDAICDGTATKAGNARLVALEAEKDLAEAEIKRIVDSGSVVTMHPGVIEAYARAIEDLRGALSSPDDRSGAVTLLRRLVEKIEVTPRVDGGFAIRTHGRLAELLAPTLRARENAKGTNGTVLMVAGEGLEPPTLGL